MNRSHSRSIVSSPDFHGENLHAIKRPRKFLALENSEKFSPSRNAVSRLYWYPDQLTNLRREVHAPCRVRRVGVLPWPVGVSRLSSGIAGEATDSQDRMVNILRQKYELAKKHALQYVYKSKKHPEEMGEKVLIDLEEDSTPVGCSEDSSIVSVDTKVEDHDREEISVISSDTKHSMGMEIKLENGTTASNFTHLGFSSQDVLMDECDKLESSLKPMADELAVPLFEKLRLSALKRDTKLEELRFQIELNESRRSPLLPKKERTAKGIKSDAFVPLTKEEEEEITEAFSVKGNKVLVTHKDSNISITRDIFRCLMPDAWLNDEVINLYLELLKEREKREPQKFLKCHFFNTFFYNKLTSGAGGYDYKSVRRWTTSRKLGYALIECDKVFVPVHRKIHWCLAVINKKDACFQYLDSLGGYDPEVLQLLSRYITDEANDKCGNQIDAGTWDHRQVPDLPEQENGYDCGLFMIKYADFYSRGSDLHFKQEDMPYFRKRTAKELLRLRAQ